MPHDLDPAAHNWVSPRDSVADLPQTKFRSRASTQGVLVTTELEPRQVFFASLGEFGLLTTLLARQDVVDVSEQQEAVYRDDAGVTRRHYFDFVVRMRDGVRKALAYKPSERVEALNFEAFLHDLAGRISPEVADEIVLITEADIPRATIRNAALLHDCRRDPPGEADAAVLAALSTVVGQISIGDLRDATGYGGEAFRAIIRLIGSRRIATKGFAAITADTLVWAAGEEGAR